MCSIQSPSHSPHHQYWSIFFLSFNSLPNSSYSQYRQSLSGRIEFLHRLSFGVQSLHFVNCTLYPIHSYFGLYPNIKNQQAAIHLPIDLHCKAIAASFFIPYCRLIWGHCYILCFSAQLCNISWRVTTIWKSSSICIWCFIMIKLLCKLCYM